MTVQSVKQFLFSSAFFFFFFLKLGDVVENSKSNEDAKEWLGLLVCDPGIKPPPAPPCSPPPPHPTPD